VREGARAPPEPRKFLVLRRGTGYELGMSRLQPILIAGPTASGKSALALRLAEALGGTIINADSMQVYRELRILTARPSQADLARVAHRLYGHVCARESYSAGRFVEEVRDGLADVHALGRRPIIVGGTGLYFKALTEGLSPIPAVDEEVRAHWRREADRRGALSLHAELREADAEMAARLSPADTQRIVRALEVLTSSGVSLAEWQRRRGIPVIDEASALAFVVEGDRAALTARADARLERMIEEGALEEVRALAALGLDPSLPAMRALGVAPLMECVRGEISIPAALSRAKIETRRYIKRQETWFNRYMITWRKINAQEMESNWRDIIAFIQSSH